MASCVDLGRGERRRPVGRARAARPRCRAARSTSEADPSSPVTRTRTDAHAREVSGSAGQSTSTDVRGRDRTEGGDDPDVVGDLDLVGGLVPAVLRRSPSATTAGAGRRRCRTRRGARPADRRLRQPARSWVRSSGGWVGGHAQVRSWVPARAALDVPSGSTSSASVPAGTVTSSAPGAVVELPGDVDATVGGVVVGAGAGDAAAGSGRDAEAPVAGLDQLRGRRRSGAGTR